MSHDSFQDKNYEPYPTTWEAWLHTKEMCGTNLIDQHSKFNQVFFNPVDEIYYKIRNPHIANEQEARLKSYNVSAPTMDNEKKALDYATLLGLQAPQRYSLAVNIIDKAPFWQNTCLATKAVSGLSIKEFILDPAVSFEKKIAMTHAAHAEILSVGFAFDDADRDMENMRLSISSCGSKYSFTHFDFEYAFSHGKMFTQKYLQNLRNIIKSNGDLKPPQTRPCAFRAITKWAVLWRLAVVAKNRPQATHRHGA
jgi:hypothetical protein